MALPRGRYCSFDVFFSVSSLFIFKISKDGIYDVECGAARSS